MSDILSLPPGGLQPVIEEAVSRFAPTALHYLNTPLERRIVESELAREAARLAGAMAREYGRGRYYLEVPLAEAIYDALVGQRPWAGLPHGPVDVEDLFLAYQKKIGNTIERYAKLVQAPHVQEVWREYFNSKAGLPPWQQDLTSEPTLYSKILSETEPKPKAHVPPGVSKLRKRNGVRHGPFDPEQVKSITSTPEPQIVPLRERDGLARIQFKSRNIPSRRLVKWPPGKMGGAAGMALLATLLGELLLDQLAEA